MTNGNAIAPDTQCVVCFNSGIEPEDTMVFGPFDNEEEAETFITCGPHGMEDDLEYAAVVTLYPPHATVVELLSPADLPNL